MHGYPSSKPSDKRVERREDTIVKTEGSILDQGDGSYVVSYFVDIAGKYEIELVADDLRRSLLGICELREADPNRCQIDASDCAIWKLAWLVSREFCDATNSATF